MTDSQGTEIIADYLSGMSLRDVGRKYGMQASAVGEVLDAARVARRRCGAPSGPRRMADPSKSSPVVRLSDEQRAAIIRMYEAGATLTAIAKERGHGFTTVRSVLHQEGVQIRPTKCGRLESMPFSIMDMESALDPLETRERIEAMPFDSFQSVWVAIVVDMLTSCGPCSVSEMAGILAAVRERYRDAESVQRQAGAA